MSNLANEWEGQNDTLYWYSTYGPNRTGYFYYEIKRNAPV